MRVRWSLAATLALLVPGLVAAQPVAQEPVLSVASFSVHPGKEKDFLDLVKKYDQPVFEKLMAESAVLGWGVDSPVFHQPGAPNLDVWWLSPDMGALGKVLAAFEEMEGKLAAEEEKAAKAAVAAGRKAPRKVMEQILEMMDLGKHQDALYRVQLMKGGPVAKGATPYIWLTFARVPPGKGAAFRATWDKFILPVYDRLLAEGTVVGFGLAAEELKTTDAFTHLGWATLPDLAAREKVRAAFGAVPEAERQQRNEEFLKVVDGTATRNMLLRSFLFSAAAPPAR